MFHLNIGRVRGDQLSKSFNTSLTIDLYTGRDQVVTDGAKVGYGPTQAEQYEQLPEEIEIDGKVDSATGRGD